MIGHPERFRFFETIFKILLWEYNIYVPSYDKLSEMINNIDNLKEIEIKESDNGNICIILVYIENDKLYLKYSIFYKFYKKMRFPICTSKKIQKLKCIDNNKLEFTEILGSNNEWEILIICFSELICHEFKFFETFNIVVEI